MVSKMSQNNTAKLVSKSFLTIALFFSFGVSQAQGAATTAQLGVIQSALSTKISQQTALMAVAQALMASPNVVLKAAGRAHLAAAGAELGRLQSLQNETRAAASNGKNPPQAAVDLAFKHVADQLSKATQTKQFGLLPLYSMQLSQLAALNNQIQNGGIPARAVASVPGGPIASAPEAVSRAVAITAVQRAREIARQQEARRQHEARQIEARRRQEEAARLQQASSWGRGVTR